MSSETDLDHEPSWPGSEELQVASVGSCRHPAPPRPHHQPCVDPGDRVVLPCRTSQMQPFIDAGRQPPSFEPAGARSKIFFEPDRLTCGIVTCGGLCPGLNNVIRSVVLQLNYAYGVKKILGFRFGYAGLSRAPFREPVPLTTDMVDGLHQHGGTALGSSRGPQDLGEMVDTLVRHDVGILFVIGGDGGLKGASALAGEVARRGLPIGVVGIPKTIDNDLMWTARSFGFDTAVEAASTVIQCAHVEAQGAWNGVGLVKLMGRHSGFIAAHATLATSEVNFCLVPEERFALEGEQGFLGALERRLDAKRHAVVVVAEGAGQDLFQDGEDEARDASGNVKLKDIGVFLKQRIGDYFTSRGKDCPVRYIDPSYTIRSLAANSFDAQFCLVLGQHAVHAGMAGRTNMVVGLWNHRFVHVPIPLAVGKQRQLDPGADLWRRVLDSTGQPSSMV